LSSSLVHRGVGVDPPPHRVYRMTYRRGDAGDDH
jgi:hypothetical protein